LTKSRPTEPTPAPAEAPAAEAPATEEPATEEPATEAPAAPAPATPLKEPGFVIATTDDSSPPPVTEGSTFHHIKNFAGTEQMMNNGEVAAQGAGADFQNGEVCAALESVRFFVWMGMAQPFFCKPFGMAI
jgi:hypothetical protein